MHNNRRMRPVNCARQARRALPLAAYVGKPQDAPALIDATAAAYGIIDSTINNVGGSEGPGRSSAGCKASSFLFAPLDEANTRRAWRLTDGERRAVRQSTQFLGEACERFIRRRRRTRAQCRKRVYDPGAALGNDEIWGEN